MQIIYPGLCNLMLNNDIEIKMNISELFQKIKWRNEGSGWELMSQMEESAVSNNNKIIKIIKIIIIIIIIITIHNQ